MFFFSTLIEAILLTQSSMELWGYGVFEVMRF